ncbi:MAG: hypothetical protein IRY97_10690 [Thermomicrobiaceae bacterium]|nr:hypothetical protein [Thermomicrobiaceae bacterium]
MIRVRNVFQAKYGRGDELVALIREMNERMRPDRQQGTILTDASGRFFTVVSEFEVESLADWERMTGEIFSDPEFNEWFQRMVPLVESGRREFYNVVE